MKGWNPHRLAAAQRLRDTERATVLSALRRRSSTTKEVARRAGLSMYQTRRALKSLRRAMLVTWLPQRKPSIRHAYTRVYVATSRATVAAARSRARRRARA